MFPCAMCGWDLEEVEIKQETACELFQISFWPWKADEWILQYLWASHAQILEYTSKLGKEGILNGSSEVSKDVFIFFVIKGVF